MSRLHWVDEDRPADIAGADWSTEHQTPGWPSAIGQARLDLLMKGLFVDLRHANEHLIKMNKEKETGIRKYKRTLQELKTMQDALPPVVTTKTVIEHEVRPPLPPFAGCLKPPAAPPQARSQRPRQPLPAVTAKAVLTCSHSGRCPSDSPQDSPQDSARSA